MSDRFFTPQPLRLGETTLVGPEAHHLGHVRRFAVGDLVLLFNGDGREYAAELLSIGKRDVHLNIVRCEAPARELGFTLHVGCALPKGDRGDFLIEKLTELGVTDFTPLSVERSVVKADLTKVEKLRRAVIEASKQCGRNVLMRVHGPARLDEWCGVASLPSRKWLAQPGGQPPGPRGELPNDVAVAIGPEGGFTAEEVAAAVQSGFLPIGLGPRILRVETAAVAVAAWLSLAHTACVGCAQ